MSLRLRLISLVGIALVVSLVLAAGIACVNASRSVGTEMGAALIVGRQVIQAAAAASINVSDNPSRDLQRLVASFDGNRHLRVSLAGDRRVTAMPVVEISPFGEVPTWFVRLTGVTTETDQVPVTIGGRQVATIALETDPRNEMLDVWNDFNNSLIVLLGFSGMTILLIYLFIGRALNPLYRLSAALEEVGGGRYETRLGGSPASELRPLCSSFNRMAAQLAQADADNRCLTEQLLTLQEQERSEIARDLHDEIGPYLFAINIDAANLSRLLTEGRGEQARGHVRHIAQSVGNMQFALRNILGRLQPAGLAEFGLREAIDNMIGFWRQRHPAVEFCLRMPADCDYFGDLLDTTIYRIVQECLSNALRHGEPTAIDIRIGRDTDIKTARHRIVLEISDDGPGLSEPSPTGFGLRGMAERIRAIGGALALRNKPEGGLAVTAVLPCPA